MLAVMITAALLGPDKGTYVPRMSDKSCSTDTQAEIMQIICQMDDDNKNSKDDELSEEDIDNFIGERNIDLLVEEQNATLRHELDVARKNLSDYITRLEHLQMSHDSLKLDKERNDRELEQLRAEIGEGTDKDLSLKALQRQINEQMDVIAAGEHQIRDYQIRIKHLEAEVVKWEHKGREAEALRDQVAEWKHAAEEYEKRANTADRYKQKLEAQQEMVRELQNVQYERSELQEQLRNLTDDRDRAERTRQSESELQKMIDQSEQHLWDERHHKDQLLRELTLLGEEVARLNAQRAHDERFIQELQDQLHHGDEADPREPGSGDEGLGGNLADELTSAATGGEGAPVRSLELSRLKAENKLLRSAQAEAAQLRQELQEEKSQRSRLQSEYNSQFQKLALVQDQAESLAAGLVGEDSQGFINLQKAWRQLATDNEEIRKAKKSLEENYADIERELTEAKSQLSASQKEGMDAISELRNTDQIISASLRREIEQVRKEVSFLSGERNNLQEQLVKAYINMENIRKNGGGGADTATDDDTAELVKKQTNKMDKLKERLIERTQVSEAILLELMNMTSSTLEEVRKKDTRTVSPSPSLASQREYWPRTFQFTRTPTNAPVRPVRRLSLPTELRDHVPLEAPVPVDRMQAAYIRDLAPSMPRHALDVDRASFRGQPWQPGMDSQRKRQSVFTKWFKKKDNQ
jgi:protein HOOK3